ncbi:hypothetical protein ADK86_03265 [Streptomyces sp. NRRL F-5755]|uniref:phage baseplate assembly protein V n=1 Tax=Streptomyces sp. NRRL F-5755 TaxID=1519475 RepID=UPI0006AF705F|nr:phage baseplate assembly protein V [Streptomyces sp. NRRL F-5755]KOU08793.1 hypothetical protein ADK86_03265 [Streptomyces sp. NRRL F-5755]
MSDNLLDLFTGQAAPTGRVYGLVVGIVTNNDDREGLGRVKVRFPWLSDDEESWWARIASPMAGSGRGLLLLPEIDDEVLVGFDQGDVRFPYVLGALWNGKDALPETGVLDGAGKVARRVWKSRTGHLVRLDDSGSGGKIEIIDSSAKNSVVIDTVRNTVTVIADGDIVLESANGDVVIGGQNVRISATTADVQIESSGDMRLAADGRTTVKGTVIDIN